MEKILRETSQSLLAIEDSFTKINAEQVNKIPFEGSWTAGQLIQHLILANGSFIEVMNGSVAETNRPADLKVEQIKDILLNFEVKFNAPEFIVPEKREYDKAQQLEHLKQIRTQVTHSIETLDLSKTCTSFELPGMGHLTRLEALNFITYHTQRHTKQLNDIGGKLE